MTEQWQELKETITEMRDNGGTGTQQEVCRFLANLMETLEKQMQQHCEDAISRSDLLQKIQEAPTHLDETWDELYDSVIDDINSMPPIIPQIPIEDLHREKEQQYMLGYEEGKKAVSACEDCISRQAVIILIDEASEMHPYKVVGDSDTYSNYNQGWSDACDWLYANIEGVPPVIPKYTDEEIDRAQPAQAEIGEIR